jgi:hypothetical protein
MSILQVFDFLCNKGKVNLFQDWKSSLVFISCDFDFIKLLTLCWECIFVFVCCYHFCQNVGKEKFYCILPGLAAHDLTFYSTCFLLIGKRTQLLLTPRSSKHVIKIRVLVYFPDHLNYF